MNLRELGQYVELLRHPLFLLLIGTLLGSLIIPAINKRIDRERLQKEARLKFSTELIERNMEIDGYLNTFLTSLELFHKGCVRDSIKLTDFSKQQADLREKMREKYGELDALAWFWYSKMRFQARTIGIQELKPVDELFEEHKKSVENSVSIITQFWNLCLENDYKPKDPAVQDSMEKTRKSFTSSIEDRGKIVSRIINTVIGNP
jgi:hypothetical protein